MSDKSKCEYCGEPLPPPPYTRKNRQIRNRHFQNCTVRLERAREAMAAEQNWKEQDAIFRLCEGGFTTDQATALVEIFGVGNGN